MHVPTGQCGLRTMNPSDAALSADCNRFVIGLTGNRDAGAIARGRC